MNQHLSSSVTFKLADDPHEFNQIYALNHRTFVEEIPQHVPNNERLLIDRFHNENTYIIGLRGERLVAMVAIRARRPFSLDLKLANLNGYLPRASSPCEIRLLAIEPDHRNSAVLAGLLSTLANYVHDRGHDLALISGAFRQLRLYRHLGFTAFGPVVGTRDASFQPMFLRLDRFISHTQRLLTRVDRRVKRAGVFQE